MHRQSNADRPPDHQAGIQTQAGRPPGRQADHQAGRQSHSPNRTPGFPAENSAS